MRFSALLIAFFLCVTGAYAAPSKAETEQQFQSWLQKTLWPKAQQKGISPTTFNATLRNVSLNWSLPDLTPPGTKPQVPQIQHQAEFNPPENYFKNIAATVNGGKTRLAQNRAVLNVIEKKYGVPAEIIVAIWGRESAFGTVKIPHNAFSVLATKAFMSSRKDMFEAELLAALEIVQKGYMDAPSMKSSWAGALGQPQFMPTSYLKYAVDFDNDGHRNIWTSSPDTLASIAAYLERHGWKRGISWGYEVRLPATLSCAFEGPDQGRTLNDWQKAGITRANGKRMTNLGEKAYLLLPAGRFGPAFLVSDNFYTLKAYNMSDLYALFIGHAADQMNGATPLKAPWEKTDKMLRSDILKLQKKLQAEGYDTGKADGLAGFKTRRSIGLWQQKNGLTPTCFPDHALIMRSR